MHFRQMEQQESMKVHNIIEGSIKSVRWLEFIANFFV